MAEASNSDFEKNRKQPVKFLQVFYFRECTVKRELKTRENFNSNALTIKFLQQTRNFVYR
jgi:hypothetical protein